MMFSDIYSTFTLHNIDIYSRHPPGSSGWPSPCRWECLWRTGACCWGCPCLEHKENVLEERHFVNVNVIQFAGRVSVLIEGSSHLWHLRGIGMGMRITMIFTQLLVWGAASVHEGLSHDREAAVHNVGLAQVKHKVRVLDEVNPEPRKYAYFSDDVQIYICVAGVSIPEGKRVWFPRMDDFRVCDTVLKSLVVQEVE